MDCDICKKNSATVHVTEISPAAEEGSKDAVQLRHVCGTCAQKLDLPHMTVGAGAPQGLSDIWNLLQQSARRARAAGTLACPDCGMTLAEFRNKGRLGCPNDYKIFGEYLRPLLQRVHKDLTHRGRRPGLDDHELERMRHLSDLRAKLDAAVRDEAYESAAQLRDAIQQLETGTPEAS